MKLGNLFLIVSFVLFASLGSSCDDPGAKYMVRILDSDSLAAFGSPYCSYKIEPVDAATELPRNFLIDVCGKYQVDDVLELEMLHGN